METAKLRPFGIFFFAFGLSLGVGIALLSLIAGSAAVICFLLETI